MKWKTLTYAYPTSPHAAKYNKGFGCYLVWVTDHGIPLHKQKEGPQAIFQDYQKWQALRLFEAYDHKINTVESFIKGKSPFGERD